MSNLTEETQAQLEMKKAQARKKKQELHYKRMTIAKLAREILLASVEGVHYSDFNDCLRIAEEAYKQADVYVKTGVIDE